MQGGGLLPVDSFYGYCGVLSNQVELRYELEQALSELPLLDPHTHLVGGKLGARGLHDLLLYHMVNSDLYGAGCQNGARLTEYPGWPNEEEAEQRIVESIPSLAAIRNTSSYWGLTLLLRDLYDWHEPITLENWRHLDGLVRERADDRSWHHGILDGVNICRTGTEIARREEGADDDRFQYSLEWAFFTRCQWGEFDTALYELERCWGHVPSSPTPIGVGDRPPTDRVITTLDDLHVAMDHYLETIPYSRLIATATHLSTDITYRNVSESEVEHALSRRDQAGVVERDVYASYINELLLAGLEKRGEQIVYQFSFAAEPLPYETASRVNQTTIAQLAEMIGHHPGLRFQCFLASRHANQSLCTLARQLPNFSLCGYWWHNFFPATIRGVMAERLDMLPTNKQIGFFSDAYCVEWVHAKVQLVRKQLAAVLGEKIIQGQYTREDALAIARAILFESPQSLLGMVPRASQGV